MNTNNSFTLQSFGSAIANKNRVAILKYLEQSKLAMNVTIVRNLKITQGQVSRHLQVLCNHDLITKTTIGKRTVYNFNKEKWNQLKALVDDIG